MIANITSPSSLARALGYNFRKVAQRQADVIAVSGLYVRPGMDYTLDGVLGDMRRTLPARHRTRNAVFHCSLNPHPDERLSGETLAAIAREYMEGMGYGGQPYIVFRHRDIAREHIHIVAPRVDRHGRKINDSFERRRSQRLTEALERQHGLRPGAGQRASPPPPLPVDAARGDIAAQVGAAVRHVLRRYAFQSLGEMNAVLNRYNVQAEEVRWEYAGRRLSGLVYVPLNARGEKIASPIRSKDLGRGAGQTAVQGKFRRSRQLVRPHLDALRAAIAGAMEGRPATVEALRRALAREGIDMRIRTASNGRLYGVTYIDDARGIAVNGSRLGREFSASALHRHFSGAPEAARPAREVAPHAAPPAPRAGEDTGGMLGGSLMEELLNPRHAGDTDAREAAWRRKLRREAERAKRRGRRR